MVPVKQGDTVKVHYTGKLEDGTVFDTSIEREAMQFTVGECQLIPGFEQAAIGMNPGESKTTRIPADEAYGQYHKEMVRVMNRSQFPAHLDLKVGSQIELRKEGSQPIIVAVVDISEPNVTIDGNHPLAGIDLTFDISLIEIV